MKKTVLTLTSLALLLAFAGTVHALEFSADVVSTSKDGAMRGKAYVTDNAARIEMPGMGASITRMDARKVIVIMDSERMYMEQPFDPRTAASMRDKVEGEVERTLLGAETIDGRPTKKYSVITESMGRREDMLQWIDDATGIPLKTSAANGEWMVEYKNLKTGPQDPELFEVPAGYKKFSVPTMDDIKAMMAGAGE